MMKLPDKWLKPKRAKNYKPATDAWWYGQENGIHVVIQNENPPRSIVGARIPKRMILEWADDIRRRGKG